PVQHEHLLAYLLLQADEPAAELLGAVDDLDGVAVPTGPLRGVEPGRELDRDRADPLEVGGTAADQRLDGGLGVGRGVAPAPAGQPARETQLAEPVQRPLDPGDAGAERFGQLA